MSATTVTIVSPEQWIEHGPQGWSYHPADPNSGRASGWGHADPSTGVSAGLGECLAVRRVAGGDGLACTCGAQAQVMNTGRVAADETEDDPEWDDDDDPYDEEDPFEDLDEEWCSAPGLSGPGLCPDDLCRGAGVCIYKMAGR